MDSCEGLRSCSGEEEEESKGGCRPRRALKSRYTLCSPGGMLLRWDFPWSTFPRGSHPSSSTRAKAGSSSSTTPEMPCVPGPGVLHQGQGCSYPSWMPLGEFLVAQDFSLPFPPLPPSLPCLAISVSFLGNMPCLLPTVQVPKSVPTSDDGGGDQPFCVSYQVEFIWPQ